MTMNPLRVVITADDLGIDERRDDGILEAHARGAISQASLLVRGASSQRAAARAKGAGLSLGLHLDLTETPSCAPPASISSLLDAQRRKLGKHGLREALARGRVRPEHIARECHAQLDLFAALTGQRATHVDGHQHVHCIPAVAAVLAPLFAARGVRTTRIAEQPRVNVDDPGRRAFYRSVSEDAARARAIYAMYGVASTDAFAGLDAMGRASSREAVERAVLDSVERGARSLEFMCHPGYAGHGVDDFNESPEREHELRVLTSLPLTSYLTDGRVALVSFDAIESDAP